MDKKLQDIHINNWKTHVTRPIRGVTIKNITFNDDYIIIEYIGDDGFKILLEIPKQYNAITID